MAEQLPRACGIAERRECHRRPDGRVRVLAAVLAHALHVALDVARAGIGVVERRIEQLDQRRVPADELRVDGVHRLRARAAHCPRRTTPPSSARSNRSGIRRCSTFPAASRRRTRRGGTRRHPNRVARWRRAAGPTRSSSVRRTTRRRVAAPVRRTASARRHRKKPSQTLSPLPPAPTRFMPSLQSPEPISGKPCAPKRRPCSMARTQCS